MNEAVDVLAIGAHPDDVELGCGGTLAHLARLGRRVAILDLTRGELGSRGTPEQRLDDAARAAQILGVVSRHNAELPDGGLDPLDDGHRRAVVRVVRALRPTTLLVPWHEQRHPDHAHASRLAEEAWFRAGLHKLDTGQEPHRPATLHYYMEQFPFEPTFVTDVSDDFATAQRAVLAYGSQFTRAAGDPEPETFLTRPGFLAGIEARARHYGELAGFRYGEPFRSRGPLAMADARALIGVAPAARPKREDA